MKIGVVTFPGSLDEVDAQRAVTIGGNTAVPLWHGDHDLKGVDAVVLPGGFSYGDYLRCGAISRFSPVMAEVIEAAGKGMPVLGICNGFQILCESHLLPGALIRNDHRKFVCRDQRLRIENARTPWTSAYDEGAEITIVLKNGEGGFVADAETLDRLEGEGRVVARYLDVNPNGSLRDIAGISNERGNVVGLMPHPEHAVEDLTGAGTDGLGFFTSLLERTSSHEHSRMTRSSLPPRRDRRGDHLGAAAHRHVPQVRHRDTELGVRIFGMVHGVVFIAYCLTTVLVAVDQRWSRRPDAARPGSPRSRRSSRCSSTGTPRRRGALGDTWRLTTTAPAVDARPAWSPGCCATRSAARSPAWWPSPRSPASRCWSVRPPADRHPVVEEGRWPVSDRLSA